MIRNWHGGVPLDTEKCTELRIALGTTSSRRFLAMDTIGDTAAVLIAALGLRTILTSEITAAHRRFRHN